MEYSKFITTIEKEVKRHNINIVGLCETCWKLSGCIQIVAMWLAMNILVVEEQQNYYLNPWENCMDPNDYIKYKTNCIKYYSGIDLKISK